MALLPRFRKRFDDWLQTSIANRFAFSALSLALVVIAVIGGLSYGAMRHLLGKSISDELEGISRLAAQRQELRFDELNRDLTELAASPLVSAALADPEGRESYLIPYLQGYRLPEDTPLLLCLADTLGRPLACNHQSPDAYGDWRDNFWLIQVMDSQRPFAAVISHGTAGKRLQVALPVVHVGALETRGMLVAELDLAKFAAGGLLSPGQDHFLRLLDAQEKPLAEAGNRAQGEDLRLSRAALALRLPLDHLGMTVEAGIAEGAAFRPLFLLSGAYAAFALALLPLVWLLSRTVSRRLTRPIIRLAQAADQVAESRSLDIRPEAGGRDEVGHLAASFGQMLERLRDSYGLLEQRVEERTRELGDSQERVRALINSVPDIIYFKDGEGRWLEVNPAGQHLFGLEEKSWAGKDAAALLGLASPASRDALLACLQSDETAWEKEGLHRGEETLPHPDGGKRIYDVIKIPLFHPDGRRRGLIALGRDITRLKQTEEQLRQLNENLERRVTEEVAHNREKDHVLSQQSRLAAMGEMIGNIAHQWRQPLNALGLLLGNIKYAQRYGELDEAFLEHSLEDGSRLIGSMSATIDDFRNFFKPDKQPVLFGLRHTTEETLRLIRPAFTNHNIMVELAAEEDVTVRGFPNEYAQVLLNLLGNAKDALLERGISPARVTLRIGQAEGIAWITIADNAGGIPDEVAEHMFDPYFTTKEKGTGIGLYMSKTIIENSMGGRLCFRNNPDGAEFTVAMLADGEPAAGQIGERTLGCGDALPPCPAPHSP